MSGVDLSRRANPRDLPELMDQPCSYADLRDCLRDIRRVNQLTFAYRPTLSWLKRVVRGWPRHGALHIVDVGCGYGDTLRRISRWAQGMGIPVSLTGIDLNPDAIRAATEATVTGEPIRWIHGDAYSYQPDTGIDIVINSLLTHHLEDPEIVRFLRWMEDTARVGWFVNDLHRTAFPYKTFQIMSRVLRLHPFPRHDGLVSIRRSFLVEDWQRLCAEADLPMKDVLIEGYRPARLCVGHIRSRSSNED